MEPVCKRCWGPVLIDIPMDMFSREMDEDLWDRTYKDSHVNFILIVEYPPIDK